MIVPMQHVTLLCLEASRRQALDTLARLGVLHTVESDAAHQAEEVKAQVQRLARARHALDEVEAIAQEAGHKASRWAPDEAHAADLDAVIETAEDLLRHVRQAESLRQTLAVWQPFGHFDPADIHRLEAEGLRVQLFRCDVHQPPEAGEGVTVRLLHHHELLAWGLRIGPGELPPGCTPIALPDRPTAEIEAQYERLLEQIRAQKNLLLAAHHHLPELRRALDEQEDRIDAARALAAMGGEGEIAWLTGFCPGEALDALHQAAADEGWGLVDRSPRPGEAVPTLVRRPRWLAPVKAVFDVLGIHPGYHEADISGVFLVFFTIFFAMLIGDAGYGAVVLTGTLLVRRKMRQAPRYPFAMLTLLSLTTIIWGALSGNYFGIPPSQLPAFMRPPEALLSLLRRRETLMQLCFLIGAVHLTVAHLWNGLLLWPSRKALAQAGWIVLVWSMYYTACGMVLQTGFPRLLPWSFAGGLLLVALFMTDRAEFGDKWIDHAMLPLSLAGCLVDVISYIRLYAVGVATLQVAESFNSMALSFELPILLRLPLVALVLLLGHALNMALCGLSILVHAVRLNTLEFSQHKGLEWAGFAYKPLRKRGAGPAAEAAPPVASLESA